MASSSISRLSSCHQTSDREGLNPSVTRQPLGCYDLLDVLGRGNFATVKRAVHVFSGEEVAVKIIDKTKLDTTGQIHLLQEVRCMRLVQHPNIVRLFEIIDTAATMYLVLELADGGDLYDYMLKNEKAMSEKTARHYFTQIVRAVDYCHQLHVVHRDLKPENVLVFRKLRMVKLTDFGFGHFYQPGTSLDTSCGSMRYSSPEILFGQKYDGPAVDVWGMGILLYAMVCGRPPFMEKSDSETISAIMDCRYPLPKTLSALCINLIGRMLVRSPEQRATVLEILQHTWLRGSCVQSSPESNELECDGGPQSAQSTLCCPLVSCRRLTDDAHERVVKTMLDGGVASHPDEINHALAADEYNNITATYYLLAERLLRMQSPPVVHPYPLLEEEEFVPLSTHFPNNDSDDYRNYSRNGLSCRPRARPTSGSVPLKRSVDLASVAEMLEELAEEEEEDLSDSLPPQTLPRTPASPRFSPSSSRRIASTKSSPHLNLLNKINEEVSKGAEEEDDFLDDAFFIPSDKMDDPGSLRNRERQLTSPERLKRIERSRRTRSRSGSGSSQTSSDTSDNDDVGSSHSGRQSGPRLPFTRHRHHSHGHRHRSSSSCSHMYRTYSRESSENASPTRGSAPVLFHTGEELETTYSTKDFHSKKRIPILQHSQSLTVIPCHQTNQPTESDDKISSHKKRHNLRPHSLPPVPHVKQLILEGTNKLKKSVSSTSPTMSTFCIRQQC